MLRSGALVPPTASSASHCRDNTMIEQLISRVFYARNVAHFEYKV